MYGAINIFFMAGYSYLDVLTIFRSFDMYGAINIPIMAG